MLCLFLTYLLESGNLLVGTSELLPKHGVVILSGGADALLALELSIKGLDVVLVDLGVGEAVPDNIVLTDGSLGHNSLGDRPLAW